MTEPKKIILFPDQIEEIRKDLQIIQDELHLTYEGALIFWAQMQVLLKKHDRENYRLAWKVGNALTKIKNQDLALTPFMRVEVSDVLSEIFHKIAPAKSINDGYNEEISFDLQEPSWEIEEF